MTHTPGPWSVWPSPDANIQKMVTFDVNAQHVAFIVPSNGEANANVMAAAPALLEALKYIELRLVGFTTSRGLTEMLRIVAKDAIAKAEGRA